MLVLPLLFALSGCNANQAPAATVNGSAVGTDHFLEGARLFAELQNPSGSAAAKPKKTDATSTKATADYLSFLVSSEALRQLLDEANVKVTDEQRNSAAKQFEEQFGGGQQPQSPDGAPNPEGKKFEDLPEWFRKTIIEGQARFQALITHVANEPDGAAFRTYYDKFGDSDFTQWCLDVVKADSQDRADAARSRIVAGEDFSTVAKSVAADQGEPALGDAADGKYGCGSPRQFVGAIGSEAVAAVQKLKVGELSPTLDLGSSTFVVIRLDRSERQTFEQARQQISPETLQQLVIDELQKALKQGNVEVNPKYGTWEAQGGQFQVVPPTGAEHPAASPIDPTLLGGGGAPPPGGGAAPPPPPG